MSAAKPEDSLRSFLLAAQPVQYRAGAFHPGIGSLDALLAERDRCREALEKIGNGTYCERRDDAAVAARRALGDLS